MDYKKIAEGIVENTGGEKNIVSILSCFTRVRVEVKDKSLVNEAGLKKLEGCQATNWMGNTIQLIYGGECNAVYDALEAAVHISEGKADTTDDEHQVVAKKASVGAIILDYIGGTIQPIIPVLIAAGMLQSIIALLAYIDIDTTTYTYQAINSIAQAGYYFLPIFLAYSASKKLKINPYVGALLGSILVYPTIVEYGSAGGTQSFLGIPVTMVSYTSSITPILISMPVVKLINNFAKKISPKVISSLLIPLITVVISAPIMLYITGPIATWISEGLCTIIDFIFNNMGFIGGAIIGAVAPYLVLTGVHQSISTPITLTELTTKGYSIFFPLLAYGNIAIGGAALGVWYKTKNSNLKQTSLSGCLMAIVGITEPALYGSLVPTKKPLISLGIMDAICSGISVIFQVKATALAFCGLGGIPAFLGDTFLIWCILMIVSFVGAFLITIFVGFEDIPEEA